MNNDDRMNTINDSIDPVSNRIKELTDPMQKTQARLSSVFNPITSSMEKYYSSIFAAKNINAVAEQIRQSFSLPAFDALKTQLSVSTKLAFQDFTKGLESNMNRVQTILHNYSSAYEALHVPTVDWLNKLDLSPIYSAISRIHLNEDILKQWIRLNEIYRRAMYESKWFPCSEAQTSDEVYDGIMDILATSRGASKRREKRIDKLILSYYTDERVREFKRNWRSSDLDSSMKRALCQAVDAYLRKEYVLTISCLATMWEGLIYMKAHNVGAEERNRQGDRLTKQDFKDLVQNNDFSTIYSDFYENFIISNCNGVNDVIDGVPNRHGAAHGWYPHYPSKKAALNAIFITDFIIQLVPNEALEEEQENG